MAVDDAELRRQVRGLINAGQLGVTVRGGIFGGCGSDCPCAVCGVMIPRDELEYEIQYPAGARHFHVACYMAWFMECRDS
ncbi:MAG TPA: hypothetical protein VGL55_02580 [Steroidobacteraceae bacterium]|jgi:hypothetical protein